MMILPPARDQASLLRRAVRGVAHADETEIVHGLVREATLPDATRERIHNLAYRLTSELREAEAEPGGLDAFLQTFALSSREGVALMCLAEALLRIPDTDTVDALIRDKVGGADWHQHVGASDSLFVNASTWGLMLTGRLIGLDNEGEEDLGNIGALLGRFLARSGEPVVRAALTHAMRVLGRQFVSGRTIEQALAHAAADERDGVRYSYDMLGEAALTQADADRYLDSYRHAIETVGAVSGQRGPIEGPGVSVKLSALHPRYEFAQRARVMAELVPRLLTLAEAAAAGDIGLTIDAEEADRLDLSLDVIEALATSPSLAGWEGLGIAVQAYQKRGRPLIDWLGDLAKRHRRKLMVRLVKGAYWDTEIKRAQERGLDDYPVFTRKISTDVSYVACARALLAHPQRLYPQFASHNVRTIATVCELAGSDHAFEFQRLYGMGEPLYDLIAADPNLARPCRVYAPVGSHEVLLPYLVRRLLENGANTSFVNRLHDMDQPIETLIAGPVAEVEALDHIPHPAIPLPIDLYAPERRNSAGLDLWSPDPLSDLATAMTGALARDWTAAPIAAGEQRDGGRRPVTDPADRRRIVGEVTEANDATTDRAIAIAHDKAKAWDSTPADERAGCLERAADLIEQERAALMALCVREAGKTIPDALAEVREAADFCRYYAHRARVDFAEPRRMPGPTGERNELRLAGRGTFGCISPWNFPLAIFTGQVTAALAAGNTVIAKPAEQTPLIAAAAVRLLHRAGVPGEVLHLLPGDGVVGARLVNDPRIAGVAFTGSTDTARLINRALAERDGPIVPLIAETGGQNAMIVDSSALAEQVVHDIMISAFQSAGQRCSALRVLYLQYEVADRLSGMIAGAMDELVVGDPAQLDTDVGPVIDAEALARLEAHAEAMARQAKLIRRAPPARDGAHGTYFSPVAFEIDSLDILRGEVFGPVLHVLRYRADRLDEVIDAVNGTGYGLTLGIHSRIEATVRALADRLQVGNAYINRNMIGAVVGAQPFGGEGLSGTGPKAGGPNYLLRFATERTRSTDTTAAGGNASLLTLGDGSKSG